MKATFWNPLRAAAWKRRPAWSAWLAGILLGAAAAAWPATAALGQVSFSSPDAVLGEANGTTDWLPAPVRNANQSPVRFSGLQQPGDPMPDALRSPLSDPFADDAPSATTPGTTPSAPPKLGEAPKEDESRSALQFLRDESILLDMGEHQWDISLQYLFNENSVTVAQFDGNNLQIGDAQIRQRLLIMPVEFRYGWSPVTQLFVNLPFGWSNGEVAFAGEDEFSNKGGIGDLAAGFTRQIVDGDKGSGDVLFTFAFSAPTGPVSFVQSLAIPGSNLGEGFWTLTGALTCIKTFDPVVVFCGIGYRHRFERPFDGENGDEFFVNPGSQAIYRLGVGFAVNPRVTFSAAFVGQYLSETEIDGQRVKGSVREPMTLRLAATIVRENKKDVKMDVADKLDASDPAKQTKQRVRTIEPFVNFGLNESAIDTVIGISCTY